MRIGVRRTAGLLVGCACAIVALAALASRMIWGYWWKPPTVATLFDKADTLRAVALWQVREGRTARAVLEGAEALRAGSWNDLPLWGWHGLMHLRDGAARLGGAESAGSLSPPDIESVWANLQSQEPWFVVDPAYTTSGYNGWLFVAEVLIDDRRVYVVGHQTSEIANDRYAYEEAVLVSDGGLRQVRSVHYFFEVSGLEFLSPGVLLVLSGIVVLTALTGTLVLRWMTKRLGASCARHVQERCL